jgi:hypothetical protein
MTVRPRPCRLDALVARLHAAEDVARDRPGPPAGGAVKRP